MQLPPARLDCSLTGMHAVVNATETHALNEALNNKGSHEPTLKAFKGPDFSRASSPFVHSSSRASRWKPSLRPFNHKFTRTSSPRVQPTCSFPLSLTIPRSSMAAKRQCEQACRDKCKCSRHAVRDEVPTTFQSLVAVEPDSSLHAEVSSNKFTGAQLPSVYFQSRHHAAD